MRRHVIKSSPGTVGAPGTQSMDYPVKVSKKFQETRPDFKRKVPRGGLRRNRTGL